MELCIACNEREVKNLKRRLCARCYSELYRNRQLPEIDEEKSLAYRKNNLIKKHGESIIDDLDLTTKIDGNFSLSNLAVKYGFTREYARQIFFSIYGFRYSAIKKAKAAQKIERMIQVMRSPSEKVARYKHDGCHYKGALAEKIVVDICNKLGYQVTTNREDSQTIDLIINGLQCEVKAAYRTTKVRPGESGEYYHFGLTKNQVNKVDFILCYIAPLASFFVLPWDEIKSSVVWIPKTNTAQASSRFNVFKEAWHLLRTENICLNHCEAAVS